MTHHKKPRGKKGRSNYEKAVRDSKRQSELTTSTVVDTAEITRLLSEIKTNTDDLVFRQSVGTFKDAFANGRREALESSVGWVIDLRNYLDSVKIEDPEFLRFKQIFTHRFDENVTLVPSDPVGKRYESETMDPVDSVHTDDESKVGIVAHKFDAGFYLCGDVVVRKQSVSVYSKEVSE